MENEERNPLSVLLVEDDADDILLIQDMLETVQGSASWVLDVAESIDQARKKIRPGAYDLFVIDFLLGAEDGLVLLQEIKALDPLVPVILLTGKGNEEKAVSALKAGASDYLSKAHLTPELLVTSMRHALEMSEKEAERQKAVKALTQSEYEKSTILNSLQDIYIEFVDPRMKIIWTNLAWCGRYQVRPDQAKGRFCYEIIQGLKKPCQGCTAMRAVETGAFQEGEMTTRDGRTLMVRSIPLKGPSGQVTGVVHVTIDITDRKRREEELAQAKVKAEDASRAKSEFLANMSHEIRTPLNSVLGMLQLLEETSLDPEQTDYVRMAMDSGRSLLTIINDVLDLSKMEAGKVEIESEEFLLHDAIHAVVRTFQPQAWKKGLVVEECIDSSVPQHVIGDRGRLRQVLFNIIGNSIKFTEIGSVRLEVTPLPFSGPGKPVTLLFSVADTGVGIKDEVMNLIFDSFTQADGSTTRLYSGAGLGLGIVRRLITLMQGTISLDSEVNKGTTVFFTLPFGLRQQREEASTSRKKPEACGEQTRILVAEDNSVSRVLIAKILQKRGYDVQTVVDGDEVLALLGQEKYDLILMDVQMPRMDGMEATSRIRKDISGRFDPRIPIIGLASYGMVGDPDRIRQTGMDDFLGKPIEKEDLLAAVARHLPQKNPG